MIVVSLVFGIFVVLLSMVGAVVFVSDRIYSRFLVEYFRLLFCYCVFCLFRFWFDLYLVGVGSGFRVSGEVRCRF